MVRQASRFITPAAGSASATSYKAICRFYEKGENENERNFTENA